MNRILPLLALSACAAPPRPVRPISFAQLDGAAHVVAAVDGVVSNEIAQESQGEYPSEPMRRWGYTVLALSLARSSVVAAQTVLDGGDLCASIPAMRGAWRAMVSVEATLPPDATLGPAWHPALDALTGLIVHTQRECR